MDLQNDRTDDFILGRLGGAERERFVGDMEKDEYLRADVALTGEIADALGRRAEKVEKMKKWESGRVVRKRLKRTTIWTASVAACAALLLWGVWPYSYYGLQDRDFLASRGTGDIYISLWNSGDYEQALTSIDSLMFSAGAEAALLSDKESLTTQESYRLSYIKLHQYELKWARIQTLLKMKEYGRACDNVTSFAKMDGPYQERAEKLKKKLKIRRRQ